MERYSCPNCNKEWDKNQLPKVKSVDNTRFIKICPGCFPKYIEVKKIKIK